ncbi:MAG: deoxyribose-phosphate aldolase [Erysipelotrichaceae bacterium]
MRKKANLMSREELALYIDHSVLKPEFTQDEIETQVRKGVEYGCRTVCINPTSIDIAKKIVQGTATKLCVVCDFPFGLSDTKSKVAQAELICQKGDIFELDLVANYGWIRSGMWEKVREDIHAVTEVCHGFGVAVKVILETDALSREEIVMATECAVDANADFIKTSTGFLSGMENRGAALDVVELMIEAARGRCKVKGSGSIRTREHFLALIDLGVDRMGIGYKSTPVVLGISENDKTITGNY